ncbi:LysM peptidoglycan-binding domain-containing M23 family metallopeptidase [Streptomyces sp. WMMC500]|uniref:M23 family metallopeptidase n=1 Tax=Streptomyces sp. WMMC500 TaxID=3015154 RepID=UPI00248ACB4A|nr:M23 family metallopeptidase [Streptomyces sp. WMMC500]WBB63363.1 LysM peptidoglycan-binding domain-containing M23 family metallopeptidase [Streptomyces sp. WMMC500]
MSSPHGRHRARRAPSGARKLATRASAAGATLALPVIGASTAFAGEDTTYIVASGDTLSVIAAEQDVDGGWKTLYENNRSVIGDDPDLIAPGMELSLDGPAAGSAGGSATDADNASYGTDTAADEPTAVMPVDGSTPTAGYEASGAHWENGHTGQDWSVPVGTTVKAAAKGTVVEAGWDESFGYQIVIKHGDQDYTHYAHLSQIDVSVGATTGMGEAIAKSGATGNVTGPHLHFEVRTTPEYGSAKDPVAWLKNHGVTVSNPA